MAATMSPRPRWRSIATAGSSRIHVETMANLGAYLSNFRSLYPDHGGEAACCRRLSHPARACRGARRLHQHGAGRCLSRRRAPGGRLSAGARWSRAAARKLGMAPDEIRRRNFISPRRCPTRPRAGPTYDSGDSRARWSGHGPRPIGPALPLAKAEAKTPRPAPRHSAWRPMSKSAAAGRRTRPRCASIPMATSAVAGRHPVSGQGHETAYAQLVAERLGIRLERIRIRQGDTERVATGLGTGGSRSLPVGGAACERRRDVAIDKANARSPPICWKPQRRSRAQRRRYPRRRHRPRVASSALPAPPIGRSDPAASALRRSRETPTFAAARRHLSQRLHICRSRDRSATTGTVGIVQLHRGRRFRRTSQPAAARRPGPWRRDAGHRARPCWSRRSMTAARRPAA